MLKIPEPDIIVVSPDGEYLVMVEVALNDTQMRCQEMIDRLKVAMASVGCSTGLVISSQRVILLRDSFEKSNGASIRVLGEAKLPEDLLTLSNMNIEGNKAHDFELQVLRWLETLDSSSHHLSDDLRELLEPMISLLRWGEVRVARPRWRQKIG